MKKDYDILIHNKIPFIYVNECKLKVKNGSILYIDNESEYTIPIANVNMLVIGHGVSLTSDAARLCAKHDCYIVFSRGQFNAHSIWHTGRYSNPELLRLQVELSGNPTTRLEVAKKMLLMRFKRDGVFDLTEIINNAISINQLLGFEASYVRNLYLNNLKEFKRDQESHESINGRLSLLGNVLYNFITTILLQKGLSPGIGFIHGKTRRGGLTFDLADIFKTDLVVLPSFLEYNKKTNMEAMYTLSSTLCKNRGAIIKEIFNTIDEIICK